MKKSLIVAVLALGCVLCAIILIKSNKTDQAKPTVAIFTTLSHPALDSVHDGFIKEMSATNGPHINFLEYNAEGNVQQANTIAQRIANDSNVIGILAIGTLAAQSIARAEKHKPIVIAAVSDPQAVMEIGKNEHICGLSDNIDADYQLTVIKTILPNIKSISLLYSPQETNSVFMIKNIAKQAEINNIKTHLIGVYESQQIATAAINACQKADVVLVPLDNLLVASIKTIIKATSSLPCAIITSNESPIHDGAAVAFGVDYEKSGHNAAMIMNKIITENINPTDIGFINPESVDVYLNDNTIKEKNITITQNTKIPLHRVSGKE